jgi:hypothetical protein
MRYEFGQVHQLRIKGAYGLVTGEYVSCVYERSLKYNLC